MKCTQIRELLPDLAAGLNAVTPETQEHIRACPACAGKLADIRKTMALLDEWQAPEPSPYFDVRLQARLREEAAQLRAGWFHRIRIPALALALSMMIAVGVGLFRGDGSKVPPVRSVALEKLELGTAVGDLQAPDKNHELYADFDVLDDLEVQQDVTANP